MRTLRELGIGVVAVYSEADRAALHVATADDAYLLGPGPASESYLRGERIVDAARRAGAEAIHPGYGFLAENAAFAREVEAAGLVWIGPPADAIEAMGSKIAARERMRAAGVPVVPGTTAPATSAEDVLAAADEVGYPIAVKASAGGGGKGLRVARTPDEVARAFETAVREGEAYFADSTRVRRAVPRRPSPRGSADPRGRARQRRPSRRARLHDPAAPPEARRGDAVAGRRARVAREDRRARGRRCPGCRLPVGRDDRRASHRRGRVLLPRDEHARAGRAHRHGGSDRHRHRPRADPDRRRRAALVRSGGRRAPRARDRVPRERRGRLARVPPRARADHGLPRAGRDRRSRGLGRAQRGRDLRPLRPA